MAMYVPAFYRLTIENVDNMIYSWAPEHKATWLELMAIDHAFHFQDKDYDGGISFIDRLYKKLGRFHPEWNLEELKNKSRSMDTYYKTIEEMLKEQKDIDYYGV